MRRDGSQQLHTSSRCRLTNDRPYWTILADFLIRSWLCLAFIPIFTVDNNKRSDEDPPTKQMNDRRVHYECNSFPPERNGACIEVLSKILLFGSLEWSRAFFSGSGTWFRCVPACMLPPLAAVTANRPRSYWLLIMCFADAHKRNEVKRSSAAEVARLHGSIDQKRKSL